MLNPASTLSSASSSHARANEPRRIQRAIVAIAAAVAVLAARAGFAADATLTSLGQGLTNQVSGTVNGSPHAFFFAGVLHITINGGPETNSYCIDVQHNIGFGDTQPQVPPAYPCEVVYILNNAFPQADNIPTRLADLNREAAAVQAAIWTFTDPFVVTAPADVVTRTNEIIAAAQSQCQNVPPVPQTLSLTPASASNILPADSTHSVTATLLDTNAQPIANYPLQVVVNGVSGPQTFNGTTNASGQLTINYANGFLVSGSDTISATASFTLPVGLEFHTIGKQALVLAGPPQTGTVTGSAQKTWVPAACGDGVVNQAGEQCDDGNQVNGDGCDVNCRPTGCGNGIVTAGEQCDDGNLIDGDGCDHNCTPTACGNGVQSQNEQCDDGNLVDGDGCDHNCTPTSCGNVIVTAGEQCDDGNLIDGDGCDHNCTQTTCGNGIVTAGEECDDGNLVSGDGCDANCSATRCGNGIVTAGEQCDDGNVVNGDGCDANCTPTACGNGIVTVGEQCDDGNVVSGDGCDANCTATLCGNGIVTPPEQCDDHNLVNGDGCDSNCTPTACGNGVQTPPEQCDDHNLVNGDGCDSNCTPTACGNGVQTAGEQCDDGNLVSGDGCDANCTPTACGNGILTGAEQCDDGNLTNGDGCEADCTLPFCGNGIVDGPQGEHCDDGNVVDGDGCSATCQLQEICTNQLDDDGNGIFDCEDTRCGPCPCIFRDPAKITLRDPGRPDFVKIAGGIVRTTPADPLTQPFGLLITNSTGVVYNGTLPPGSFVQAGKRYKYRDVTAKKTPPGLHDGFFKVGLFLRDGIWHVKIVAYGDLDQATVSTMTTQIVFGDEEFIYKASWIVQKTGWKLQFPSINSAPICDP